MVPVIVASKSSHCSLVSSATSASTAGGGPAVDD